MILTAFIFITLTIYITLSALVWVCRLVWGAQKPVFLVGAIMSSVYHWMMCNLPFRLMYKHTWIDSQHKMWLPRFGWSKKQIADAEKSAKEKYGNIKWE
jgi:hypothetical protein